MFVPSGWAETGKQTYFAPEFPFHFAFDRQRIYGPREYLKLDLEDIKCQRADSSPGGTEVVGEMGGV